jgi:hypothetical protein
MVEIRNAHKILMSRPTVKDHSKDLSVRERMILKWVLWESGLGSKLDLPCSGQGMVAGYCKQGHER